MINQNPKTSCPTHLGVILKDLSFLLLVIGIFFGLMLGTRPLSAPDEGRYTEIPREMAFSEDYVTPRLNGVKYFEKPPLMYWLGAASIKFFGVDEGALRFWPALFALLGCMMVYGFGLRFYTRKSGIHASLLLATTILFYAHSRLLILDMGVTFFLSASLFSYIWMVHGRTAREQNLAACCFFSAMALSVLTKGLIGIAIPGMIILLWCGLTRNWGAFRMAFKPWGVLLFLAIAAPWHIMAALRNPEFVHFYFIHEHVLRYLTPVHGRTQPLWFFIPIVIVGVFPWTGILVETIIRQFKGLRERQTDLFLVIWIAFIFVFFSLSNSKLIPYILPVFPPMAVLMGVELETFWHARVMPRRGAFVSAFMGVLVLIAMPVALHGQGLLSVSALYPLLGVIILLLLLGGAFLVFAGIRNKPRGMIVALYLTGATLLPVLNMAWPYIDSRSVRTLAHKINQLKKPGDLIVAWGRYYQDLPPYVNQKIMVVGWRGELEFGMSVEDTSSWMMDKERFLKVYNPGRKVYIVTRKEFVQELEKMGIRDLQELASTSHDILLTNKQ